MWRFFARSLSAAFCLLPCLPAVCPRISASFRVSVRLLAALHVVSFFRFIFNRFSMVLDSLFVSFWVHFGHWAAKGRPMGVKGSPREAAGRPKGGQGRPNGDQERPLGGRRGPDEGQREAKGGQGGAKGRPKGGQGSILGIRKGPKTLPKWV